MVSIHPHAFHHDRHPKAKWNSVMVPIIDAPKSSVALSKLFKFVGGKKCYVCPFPLENTYFLEDGFAQTLELS